MKAKDIFEGEVIPFPSKKSKYGVTFDDLYRSFIHDWNSGDEWGDTMATLFAVATELHKREGGPPDSWNFSPGAGGSMKSYSDETEQDKYDRAVSQQSGEEFDEYEELKYADTKTLEKFGEMLMRIRDKLDAEGKSY